MNKVLPVKKIAMKKIVAKPADKYWWNYDSRSCLLEILNDENFEFGFVHKWFAHVWMIPAAKSQLRLIPRARPKARPQKKRRAREAARGCETGSGKRSRSIIAWTSMVRMV